MAGAVAVTGASWFCTRALRVCCRRSAGSPTAARMLHDNFMPALSTSRVEDVLCRLLEGVTQRLIWRSGLRADVYVGKACPQREPGPPNEATEIVDAREARTTTVVPGAIVTKDGASTAEAFEHMVDTVCHFAGRRSAPDVPALRAGRTASGRIRIAGLSDGPGWKSLRPCNLFFGRARREPQRTANGLWPWTGKGCWPQMRRRWSRAVTCRSPAYGAGI